MFNKILKRYLSSIAGQKKYQSAFETLHALSLNGMNVGGGGNTKDSGEIQAIEYIKTKLQGNAQLTIFDVGANVGNYSLMLKQILGDNAHLYAFEPSRKTYEKLVACTTGLPNTQTFNMGLGEEESSLSLFTNAPESGLASVYQRKLDHFNLYMNQVEEVQIKAIDDFCREKGIEQIHFLKLDVEGHEMKVLKGAADMLARGKIDYIQFEFGGCNIDSRTYFQDFYYLLKDQYTIYRIVKDGLHKLGEYKETYEMFVTVNYLAERNKS